MLRNLIQTRLLLYNLQLIDCNVFHVDGALVELAEFTCEFVVADLGEGAALLLLELEIADLATQFCYFLLEVVLYLLHEFGELLQGVRYLMLEKERGFFVLRVVDLLEFDSLVH